jgi:hypothetical protein
VPIYHFIVHDGSNVPDPDGTELASLSVARLEAVKLAGELLRDQPQTFWDGSDWHLDVTDERGHILFRLDFTATNTVTEPV